MPQGSSTASLILLLLPLVLIGFMLYSARKRARTMAEFSASLKVGDEVVMTSGIYGRIVALEDELAKLEVAPGTTVTIDRRGIGMRAADMPGAPTGLATDGTTTADPTRTAAADDSPDTTSRAPFNQDASSQDTLSQHALSQDTSPHDSTPDGSEGRA